MKAILIVCLLLASIFFIPSSNAGNCPTPRSAPRSAPACRPAPPALHLRSSTPPTPGPLYRKPTTPSPGKCGRGIPYRRCISSPALPQSLPLKPLSPPLKPPTPPTPGPPYRKPPPPSGCSHTPYRRCAPPTP